MAVQFAGSRSTGDRRRRRLVANGDTAGVDASLLEGDGADMQSQLVASAAAGPWVPITEFRIWTYASLIGLFLIAATVAVAQPSSFPQNLSFLSDHFFTGPRPLLLVFTEVLFLAFSAQLSVLIGWYRSRGKLDFGGHYRVWPWAVGLFALAAFSLSTNTHRVVGVLAEDFPWLTWRGATVAWQLPLCLLTLPIALLIDRDTRHSRSSLWTLRTSGLLWLTEAWLELYQPELQTLSWFPLAFSVIPLFASATLFLGLWLHARVVAYVCPDPPQLNERSAWSLLLSGCAWIGMKLVSWGSRHAIANQENDDDFTPKTKRTRKKIESVDEEEPEAKPKRKPAARRPPARTRTRSRPVDEEVVEESSEETTYEESEPLTESSNESTDEGSPANESQEQWEEQSTSPPVANPTLERNDSGRVTQIHSGHGSSVPAPHSRRSRAWQEEPAPEEAETSMGDSAEESEEDRQFQLDSGMSADQMKGLSKRQKRDLKKQLRDQQRARGR